MKFALQTSFMILFVLVSVGLGADSRVVSNRTSEIDQIESDIAYFAADAMEGRDTGTEQLVEASKFLRKRLQAAGYTFPDTETDGYQEFSIAGRPKLGEKNRLEWTGSADEELTIDEDYRVCSFGGNGEFSAPVVFCGYGIDDPENNFNEFAGLDLEGKVALIMRRVPRQLQFGSLYVNKRGIIDATHAGLRSKMKNAKERGAIAVLFVNDPHTARQKKDDLFSFGYGGSASADESPVFQITIDAANQLLEPGMSKKLTQLEVDIDKDMKPRSQLLDDVVASGRADMNFDNTQTGNVIAVLEPADLEAMETVIVGAHYDHVGWGAYGSLAPGTKAIHNGADDNASGSIALLTLAERLSEQAGKLNRRVVLIWFSGEERGLLGSKHYVGQPIYPLDETVAMLNLDMVGRLADEKLTVFGVGSSKVWDEWLNTIENETELNFFRKQKSLGPSDHAPFYQAGIPVLHLFTGLHEDYHRPTDDVDEINAQGVSRVVDVLEALVLNLAEGTERLDYIENKKWIRVGRHAGGRAYVGIIPELNSMQTGLTVRQVAQNSPAAQAGLMNGDRIVQVADTPVETRSDFWQAIDSRSPEDEVMIQVLRDGQTVDLTIELGNPR